MFENMNLVHSILFSPKFFNLESHLHFSRGHRSALVWGRMQNFSISPNFRGCKLILMTKPKREDIHGEAVCMKDKFHTFYFGQISELSR